MITLPSSSELKESMKPMKVIVLHGWATSVNYCTIQKQKRVGPLYAVEYSPISFKTVSISFIFISIVSEITINTSRIKITLMIPKGWS